MSNEDISGRKAWVYRQMVHHPLPFLVTLPIIFAVFIGVGWTRDSIVEDEVNNIWIPTTGSFAQDKDYANRFGKDDLTASSFAAMAIARDGGNLFNEDRLNEIRARMEKAEATTIEYKGVTYTWQDVCASNNAGKGTVYEFPCVRLSPMDLFQEARWFFDENDKVTWHQKIVQESLVQPLLPRFGIMTGVCASNGTSSQSDACDAKLEVRLSPDAAEAAGLPRDYANPLSLFADIANMEINDPCRLCIDAGYKATIDQLQQAIPGAFGIMAQTLSALNQTLDNDQDRLTVLTIAGRANQLFQTITRADVEDFWYYYVTRGLYAQLGAASYAATYNGPLVGQLFQACDAISALPQINCPTQRQVTAEEALQALFNHADNTFSSVNTAGNPLPFWSEGDGTGNLFEGSEPIGGSGVDMSAQLGSMFAYFDIQNFGTPEWAPLFRSNPNGLPDPLTPGALWSALIDKDPTYNWFMASLIPADEECSNGFLPGTSTGTPVDDSTGPAMASISQPWCTKYNLPNSEVEEGSDMTYTKQHFARMWYDLLVDSPGFLSVIQGQDDPYTWTTGQGCGYDLRGERTPYTGRTEDSILFNASGPLYYIDEGESVGAITRNLLIGGSTPSVNDYSYENPLQSVSVIQTLYASLIPNDIPDRVRNCNRPGGPVEITVKDAEEILSIWKEEMENAWTEGWDDDSSGDVQFVAFFDDGGGVAGTTGRMLTDITLDNGKLTAISIVIIVLFSAFFMVAPDPVESRVLLVFVGVTLVVLSYFGSVGLAILFGIKLNVTTAWTMPFIMLGLGVDDTYLVLQSLRKQRGYEEFDFVRAMKQVTLPVTLTSLINASMFAVLNISDIPAVYLSARVALICVILLYLSVLFCFPAFCWLDLQRQKMRRRDVLICTTAKEPTEENSERKEDFRQVLIYKKFYEPLILGKKSVRMLTHSIIWLIALGLFGVSVWGITEREVGLGLEDFFPEGSQAQVWAQTRTEELASWSMGINWGDIDYTDPDVQMQMIGQFEGVLSSRFVAEVDTKRLWMANFLIWTTRQCDQNFQKESAPGECGADIMFMDNGEESPCMGMWMENDYDLRVKIFEVPGGDCEPYEGGICRPDSQMHPLDKFELGITEDTGKEYCPVVSGWSDDKWKFCLRQWRNITGFTGGNFVLEDNTASETECAGEFNRDAEFVWPMPYSAGPTMFAYDMFSHELTLEMLKETRESCDDMKLRCWLTGIPFDYWSQYEGIFTVLVEIAGFSALVGFLVAWIFLFVKVFFDRESTAKKAFFGSLIGASLIVATILLSLTAVVGLSILAGVNLTGFSNMSFVLSTGFSVEYSVHIVSKFITADPSQYRNSLERVKYCMSFLMIPTFMSFVSSVIGVVCMAFTDFEFTRQFFFTPLIIVMFVTYFYGCWWLPAFLTLLNFETVQLGRRKTMFTSVKNIKDIPDEESSDDVAATGAVAEAPKEEAVEQEKDEAAEF